MLHSLSESPFTYTTARVEQILEDDLDRADPKLPDKNIEFIVEAIGFRLEQKGTKLLYRFPTSDSRKAHAASLCSRLIDSLDDPTRHVELMDEAFSSLIKCHFRPTRPIQEISEQVCALLSRLPATPLEITDTSLSNPLDLIPGEFFLAGRDREWSTLRLVRHVTRNIIRVPLCWSIMPRALTAVNSLIYDFTENVAELFEFSLYATEDSNHVPDWKLFLIKAFLWTQWQRCVMLNSWFVLNNQIQAGFHSESSSGILVSRMTSGLVQTSDDSSETSTIKIVHPQPVPYVCKWALRLLQTDRGSVTFDLRRLFYRYAELFGHLPPRCIKLEDGMAQCEGGSLYKCNRFVGMKIEDQTAHTKHCGRNCHSLHWDEESYRNTEGARAVSLDQKENGLLQYCTASERTMAISHVWSHGQGGRPELGTSGLNSCLHNRYLKIAKSKGCDSYWMDTPCIPQDPILRREAIEQINSVFANSKLTLVCDRDLMSIEISEISLELQESILAVILLCDWNVRAWTLLEALRGRKNVQILCADDETMSLREMLYTVQKEGSIDLAILYLTSQHLLPAKRVFLNRKVHKDWWRNETEDNGIFKVEEAAALMSLRHASRRGDEIVIWSLLHNDKVPRPYRSNLGFDALSGLHHSNNDDTEENTAESLDEDPNSSLAEAFWRMRVGKHLYTGFLMSSAPRDIKRKGLTWAPSCPTLPPLPLSDLESDTSLAKESYMSFDGRNTNLGIIAPWGLMSHWLMHVFKKSEQNSGNSIFRRTKFIVLDKPSRELRVRLSLISARFLRDDAWGALLHTMDSVGNPARYRGRNSGTLFAVVGSSNLSVWRWRGLYNWDNSIPLPDLEEQEIVLE
ncbi:uncharacterized protein PAC_19238 [Phialocephala subalpina]|uniref:Heterokaryon incompatibility domain-containing protein n=1 Tax=Phialocephala subalpina TaxID=576137 RepID=A0A1L7XWG2_9HELO|nr:uncharacterized protein PAC_19238 [Phialocephala subalpina]